MTEAQILRFALGYLSRIDGGGKTVATATIGDMQRTLEYLKKCKYHLNPICPEALRTTRNDLDNKHTFSLYFKKMIHYVELPPRVAPPGSITLESLGMPPDATMQDVMLALKRSREMTTIHEEDEGHGESRPAQRRRTDN